MATLQAAARRIRDDASRSHWLDASRLRLYSCVALACYALYFGIWLFRACVLKVPGVFAPGGDFVVFWSTAKLALSSGAAAPYDLGALRHVELSAVPGLAIGDGVLPWLYPPMSLWFVLPFGLLPYGLATFVFLVGGVAWFAWALCRTLSWRDARLAAVAFPGIVVVLATGQNSLWLAGCAGLALTCLRSRPLLAGVLLGVVAMKPQLALMVPVALLCARAWRALGAMVFTTLVLTVASLLVFGSEPFAAFLRNAAMARESVEQGSALMARMPTVFASIKLISGGLLLPYAIHGLVAAAALASVVYAWSRPCSFALRAAVLVVAGLLVPAYLYDYDLVFLGLAIAWLGAHGHRAGWLRGERELLVLLWLMPLWSHVTGPEIGFQPLPLGLMLALALGVWRIRLERMDKASFNA
ncbi:glycosyl transferase family 87 [Cupriavidus metallidurans]|jgi:hypothetical protein|uniref:DUF2029 domain-containing protein n=1 Tax=Cupriavidus metallidurans (strain ATCC 43123 / DSM 2839 / NBRC 102507 / CH34) TaxID=266264 RepID=Q1LQN5_CUPMC|nr:glycosyltransferase family 87 protein [Cupriavidus metallidurans]ABF07541.1 conserved hypothetical protein; putative membrane protein [Cupriavidus metallidurans CH34]AVA32780.1 DUF2029 domain-containing protein [Cupriavidus metallidurans]MDE4916949.1 glycosyltransferase family 87 protein [Cupriavidus metallidurans]QGS28141.1 DUF2029 domain-containing protein [Cupriavidus metallidurans]